MQCEHTGAADIGRYNIKQTQVMLTSECDKPPQ